MVFIFAFGCPTRVPNFSSIKVCVPELVVFVFVQKEEQKRRTKTETLLTCISEMASAISFNFGM